MSTSRRTASRRPSTILQRRDDVSVGKPLSSLQFPYLRGDSIGEFGHRQLAVDGNSQRQHVHHAADRAEFGIR